jgi:hypothetical protein
VPPLDCAWLWHNHKLAPGEYAADCQARGGAAARGARAARWRPRVTPGSRRRA